MLGLWCRARWVQEQDRREAFVGLTESVCLPVEGPMTDVELDACVAIHRACYDQSPDEDRYLLLLGCARDAPSLEARGECSRGVQLPSSTQCMAALKHLRDLIIR